ncbi:MAG TPA: DEAD/DEAH box helicase family protein [Candidatus Tidjanibacter gallistercoris]|nr:DEAD/DEAH box helicase family protein [Candidatus Tidjanibacter gallistercoris]
MELKQYQREVIGDLRQFLEQLEQDGRLDTAFNNFWGRKGISPASLEHTYLHPYDNSITGVPHVTVKVPTAGGKTFIACNALRTIFNRMPAGKPQVVAWFVPSDTILKQTYKNLNDSSHPYRQKIDSHFGNAVQVVDKEAALCGRGISPTEIREQLTIFVLSVQSFAANNKDGRRVYRENGSLTEYPQLYDGMTKRIGGADETGFIQVLSYLNPVVIIDESHNFEANLRVDMLKSINPCFILDLTATPRSKSNIISFVDAIKLKRANMVKLPVIVYNHRSTNDVIASAMQLQRSLEVKAERQEAGGGRYIRPIVLFQAQPRTDDDNITFDKIKAKLASIGIPEEQIKIKTAGKDEIKNTDLMARDCPVRYIITVNALKEGWDCPFAYILASLANKSSRVDVEQILGRILRLPYATRHEEELLNLSYVFTSSANFRDTIENIIAGLNRAGFSKKDYRVADAASVEEPTAPAALQPEFGLFADAEEPESGTSQNVSIPEENITNEINAQVIKEAVERSEAQEATTELEAFAQQENENYNRQLEAAADQNDGIPDEVKDAMTCYRINDIYKERAKDIVLPVFVRRVNQGSIFAPEGAYIPLNKAMLTEGFDLGKQDRNIDFTRADVEAVRVDLEKVGEEEYRPARFNLSSKQLAVIREHFAALPSEAKKEQLAEKIARNIHFDEIAEPQIIRYIKDVIKDFDTEQIADLYTFELQTTAAIRSKIETLLCKHQKDVFHRWLDTGQIKCEARYKLPETMTLQSTSTGWVKGLYAEEGDMNDFEYRVINAVANLENVSFWHRNSDRRQTGFCINGFINHYPDFIVWLDNGITILLETKGDDRDNSDSRNKIELGAAWAGKAGNGYRYFMVFDKKRMDGAITVNELLERLKEMQHS